MLQSSRETTPPPGTFTDVVNDYMHSHAHQENVEVFCTAIKLALDKSKLVVTQSLCASNEQCCACVHLCTVSLLKLILLLLLN